MTEYTPFSKRYNITDKDIGWLLDYIERVMGWDIEYTEHSTWGPLKMWWIRCWPVFYIGNNGWIIHFYTWARWPNWKNRPAFSEMTEEVFYRTYKSLLPVIRDLYPNKN